MELVHETRCLLEPHARRCPHAGCPFWEAGGAVLRPGCFLRRVLPDADWTPELVERWRGVRELAARSPSMRLPVPGYEE